MKTLELSEMCKAATQVKQKKKKKKQPRNLKITRLDTTILETVFKIYN